MSLMRLGPPISRSRTRTGGGCSDDGRGGRGYGVSGAREAVRAERAEPVEGAGDGHAPSECAAAGRERGAFG